MILPGQRAWAPREQALVRAAVSRSVQLINGELIGPENVCLQSPI
jgi:hypothetical protein